MTIRVSLLILLLLCGCSSGHDKSIMVATASSSKVAVYPCPDREVLMEVAWKISRPYISLYLPPFRLDIEGFRRRIESEPDQCLKPILARVLELSEGEIAHGRAETVGVGEGVTSHESPRRFPAVAFAS